jgi:hypothetical protein
MPGGGGPRRGAGRPKGSVTNKTLYQHQMDLAVLCRRQTHIILNALTEVAINGNANERTAAARELAQRGYGMPRQPVDIGGQDGGGHDE